MRLTFHGAAGEVTGSCFLVDTGEARFLIDCGMFQGGREARRRNRKFGFDPKSIDFVLLSHAHIDHSGLLPRLVAQGFRGAIHATPATCDLLSVMLPDAAWLQEKEAEREDVAPLYTLREAQACLARLAPSGYGAAIRPHDGIGALFRDAGHILGSAIVEARAGGLTLVSSGDLGQPGRPILDDPAPVAEADVLLVESTYGNRNHKSFAQTLDEFAYALNDTLRSRRGNVVIPSFAVGRTQDILWLIGELRRQGRVPQARVYVDSPMASAATRITLRHAELEVGEDVRFTESLEDSMRINSVRSGAVIVSASGMCEGGRIRHHLKHNLPRAECAIVFVGFQAAGTLGRRIVEGARSVRLFGQSYPVRARVFTIGGLSAHADQAALLDWLGKFRRPPRRTFIVHGEPLASGALQAEIAARLGWEAEVPRLRETVEL